MNQDSTENHTLKSKASVWITVGHPPGCLALADSSHLPASVSPHVRDRRGSPECVGCCRNEKWVEAARHSAKDGSVWKARVECWVQPPKKTRRAKRSVPESGAGEGSAWVFCSEAQPAPRPVGLSLQVSRTVDPGLCRLSPASVPRAAGEGPPVLTSPPQSTGSCFLHLETSDLLIVFHYD